MSEGHRYIQYAATFCVTLSLVYQGILLGWPSPVLPKLLGGETTIKITKEQCSWLASLVALGAPPGCFLAQYLGDALGRKKTILILAVPGIVGSGMMLFITTPFWMYISRFTAGLGGAMALVEVSIYLGEIADKEIRGALGSLVVGMANLGNLMIYGIGPFVSYDTINWICFISPIIFLLSCLWIPESPYYHLKNDDLKAAGQEMMKLKGLKSTESIEDDLIRLHAQVKKDMENKTSITELLKKKEYRKGVIAMTGLKILQQMTGTLAIQSYLETIFRQASIAVSGATVSIIFGVVQLCAGFIATLLVDKMGRKPLLLISALGVGVSLTSVGSYFYMQNVIKPDQTMMDAIAWLPVTGIGGFTILFAIGIGNLPYVLQSEIFPTNVRSAASSIFTASGATIAFFVAKTFQGLIDSIGVHTVFWMFAIVSYCGVVFVYFYVPETKGKTIEDIIREMNGGKSKDTEQPGEEMEAIPLQSEQKKLTEK